MLSFCLIWVRFVEPHRIDEKCVGAARRNINANKFIFVAGDNVTVPFFVVFKASLLFVNPKGNQKRMDPAFQCLSLLRRRKYDECIEKATDCLTINPYDQQLWWIKARALTQKQWIDDTEMEEEGVAEMLLDDNAIAAAPRPGTSLKSGSRGGTGSQGGSRPQSGVQRPLSSGFARPGSSASGSRSGRSSVESAFQGNRPGTSRPVTTSGRFVRLGTASMRSEPGGPFIDIERMDLKKYAERAPMAKVLCDYLIYHDRNPKKALELCAEATALNKFQDWWWKARLAKCYYQLGLYRDAEKQFQSALKHQPMVVVYLELGKVYVKLDQPLTVLELFEKGTEMNPTDTHLLLGMARTYDQLADNEKAVDFYRRVLAIDSSNPEAIACIASYHFYEDQPEIALRLYRRLLQMGVNNTELWNNLGLCCFYASQYDMTISCFERALTLAGDDNLSDVYYNIGQLAIGIGDLGLAYQAFKVSMSVDAENSAESHNNLGILELRKNNIDAARNCFRTATELNSQLVEPLFNGALLAFKIGELQEAFDLCNKALEIYPQHTDSLELKAQLKETFGAL